MGTQVKGTRISPLKVLESLSALRIESTSIKSLETENLGTGRNADVIPAELEMAKGPTCLSSSKIQHVAVKKLRMDDDTGDARTLAVLAHEVSLMQNLSHKNIVKLIGFVEKTKDGIAWVILPWEKNGNLREFIWSTDWELPERLALIYDVAMGIQYLHSRKPPICHGDLKSLNVLVSATNHAVLTDFGSARAMGSEFDAAQLYQVPNTIEHAATAEWNTHSPKIQVATSGSAMTLTGPMWSLRWAAPELLGGSLPSLASDIWAFGWICWEVVTGNFPFDAENDSSAVLCIVEGRLPVVSGNARLSQVMALSNLMIDCWNSYPSRRPTANACERQVHWMDRTTPSSRSKSASVKAHSARLLSSVAHMHLSHGRTEEAEDHFRQSMAIARSTKDNTAIITASQQLGHVCRLKGKYVEAVELYTAALDLSSQVGNTLSRAQAFNGLGEVYRLQGEHSKAEECYISARDISSQVGNKPGLANSLLGLGDVHRLRGDFCKAEDFYITARDICSRIENQNGVAYAVKALGDVYRVRGELSKAEECYVTALEACSRLGNQSGLAYAVKALGNVYRQQGINSKAEKSYIAARDICSRIGNPSGFAYAVKSLGDLYCTRREYSKAEESYITAGNTYTRIGDQLGLANTRNELGTLYVRKKRYADAEKLYQEARETYTSNGNNYALAHNLRCMGCLCRRRKRYEEAGRLLSEASILFGKLGMEKDVMECKELIKALGSL